MRIESLTYFLEIAQAGSFSLAARHLYVSQQGLSKSIQALERELGTTLFERTGKRVRLTEAGRDLAPLARACIESQKNLLAGMRKHVGAVGPAKTVRLTAMPFVASGMFSFMKDRLDAYDLRNVALVERGFPEILADLAREDAGSATLAMVVVSATMRETLAQNPAVTFAPLFESRLMLMGTKRLISPKRQRISVDEVVRLPLAYYSEPVLESVIADTFADKPFENIIMHTSNIEMMNEYVETGQAVTFSDTFSAYLLGSENNELLFMPIEGAASFSVGFAHRADPPLDNHLAAYAERFRSCIGTTCKSYLAKTPAS